MKYKQFIANWFYKLRYKSKHIKVCRYAEIFWKNAHFEGYNKIGSRSKFKGYMGYGSYIGECSQINATIGRYSCISDRVNVVSGTHPTKDFVSIHPAFYSTAKQAGFSYTQENCFEERRVNPVDGKTAVYIGNDVWIGCDVTILGGAKIGDGAIIAAGAIVTQDVEPFTIVGGVPAKPIKKRFSQEQIDFLQEFCWWDKSPAWLKENCAYMKDIEAFRKNHSQKGE